MARKKGAIFVIIMNLENLNILKRRKKYISLLLRCNIRSKRASRKSQYEIQKQVIKQMKTLKANKITNDIAVQIISYTSDKRVPGIANWTKNLIDILYKEFSENIDERNYLPFNDDKQIKYLFTLYRYGCKESKIYIKIIPFSSFIADVQKICMKYNSISLKENEESNYQEMINNKQLYLQGGISEKAYESLLSTELMNEQILFGRRTAINLDFIYLCYSKQKNNLDCNKKLLESLLNFPIRIKLPGLPKGGSKNKEKANNYKTIIEIEIRNFLEKYPYLKKLQIPIIISVIYCPLYNYKEKDIDNIVLQYLIPVVNKLMNPKCCLFNQNKNMEELSDNKSNSRIIKNSSCVGYEIIRIPPKHNSADGQLYLTFKYANDESIIDSVEKKIDEIINEN